MPPPLTQIDEAEDDIYVQAFSRRGCCFWIPCFGSNYIHVANSSAWWERIKTVDHEIMDPCWWTSGWKRLREWSELTAGPKWKTFIRTFRKNYSGSIICIGGGGGSKQPKFQYDPLSYSLNFDDGLGCNGHYIDEDFVARDFSTRFASVAAICHSRSSSLNFGKGAPPNLIR